MDGIQLKTKRLLLREWRRQGAKGDNREAYEFAVELKSEKKVIGGVSLNKIDRFHGTAGGGSGLMRNTTAVVMGQRLWQRIEFAFNTLGCGGWRMASLKESCIVPHAGEIRLQNRRRA